MRGWGLRAVDRNNEMALNAAQRAAQLYGEEQAMASGPMEAPPFPEEPMFADEGPMSYPTPEAPMMPEPEPTPAAPMGQPITRRVFARRAGTGGSWGGGYTGGMGSASPAGGGSGMYNFNGVA
jgi:hypothetical protein